MEHVQSEVRVDHEIIIVGAGFSGLGLGIQLKKRYLHDFVILERAGDLGGTWRDNTYPGLTVDIPSASYSYPFEPNPDWTHVYARGLPYLPHQITRDNHALDLRSPLVDLQQLGVAHQFLDYELLRVAVAAENLHRIGGRAHRGVPAERFRTRAMAAAQIACIHGFCGVQTEQA